MIIVTDSIPSLDRTFTKGVFLTSDYGQPQISFPTNKAAIIYAEFGDGSRARMLFTQVQDSVTQTTTNQIQARYQPPETPQLPFY